MLYHLGDPDVHRHRDLMKQGSKKVITCKKCGTGGLRWENNGRWLLFDPSIHMFHHCPKEMGQEVKYVECKYCHEQDLWWSKEKMPDGTEKNMLIESFGIPHFCKERKEHFDKLSQDKKDEYAREKAKIEAIPDKSPCGYCHGGFVSGLIYNSHPYGGRCRNCDGSGKITANVKKRLLYEVRKRIWPGIMRR